MEAKTYNFKAGFCAIQGELTYLQSKRTAQATQISQDRFYRRRYKNDYSRPDHYDLRQ